LDGLLTAAPAFALTVSDVDTDGDSPTSFTEMAVALYPDLAEEAFAAVDTSGDSLVTRRNSQPLSKLA
jgi:hypothetical protein